MRALYAKHESALLASAGDGLTKMVGILLVTFALLGVFWVPIMFLALRGSNNEERMLRTALRQRQESTLRAELDSQIQRGLEMARTEDEAYGVVTSAPRALPPVLLGEFLVADSSRAHFRQVSGSGPEGQGPGCPVGGPTDCPATSIGQTMSFPSSTRIDACPWLRDRADGACSAVCVPVAIAGRTIGVLHVTGESRRAAGGEHGAGPRARRSQSRRTHRDAARVRPQRDRGAHRSAHRAARTGAASRTAYDA